MRREAVDPSSTVGGVVVPEKFEGMLEPIDAVFLSRRNARKGHAVDTIARSLKKFGWHSVVVAARSGEVLIGNGRWKAAKKLGLESIPVLRVDDDDRTAIERMIADNRLGELSEWNDDNLRDLVESFGGDILSDWHMGDMLEGLVESDDMAADVDLSPPSLGSAPDEDARVFIEISVQRADLDGVRSALATMREAYPAVTMRTLR
jgi:hypothetical protein